MVSFSLNSRGQVVVDYIELKNEFHKIFSASFNLLLNEE